MPNHVHLIHVPATANGLALALGETHRRSTGFVNARMRVTGMRASPSPAGGASTAYFRRGGPFGRPVGHRGRPREAPLRFPALYPSGDLRDCHRSRDIFLDIRPHFSYKPRISLT
jgi:hypothetical protein